MPDDVTRDQLRRRLLGWSIACEPIFPGLDVGRDLVLAGGDLARDESIDALGQSLALALTTARGSDIFDTSFGFDGVNALAEESDRLLARERVRISVIRVLQADPRVRQIVDVDLDADRLGSRRLNVTVAFETVSLDRTTINLGSVVPDG